MPARYTIRPVHDQCRLSLPGERRPTDPDPEPPGQPACWCLRCQQHLMLAAHHDCFCSRPWGMVGITRGSMAQPLQLAPSEVSWLGVARTEQCGRRRALISACLFSRSLFLRNFTASQDLLLPAASDLLVLCCRANSWWSSRPAAPSPTSHAARDGVDTVQTEIGRLQHARFSFFSLLSASCGRRTRAGLVSLAAP